MIGCVLELTQSERETLEARVRSRSLRADDVRRARLVLMLADGLSYTAIQAALGCNAVYVSRWKKRFEAERLAGLFARKAGSRAEVLTPALEARILARTAKKPTDGTTHWSTRRLAKAMKLSNHMLVARAWKRANLKPHRMA